MRKDSLLQCMHEAAAQHRTPSISPISLQSKTKLGFNFVEPLWYGRSWPRSQSEGGKSNLEWKKNTFILSNYNELVDILSSGMETPCQSWSDMWNNEYNTKHNEYNGVESAEHNDVSWSLELSFPPWGTPGPPNYLSAIVLCIGRVCVSASCYFLGGDTLE